MLKINKIQGESWICNCYIISIGNECIVIDPGGEIEPIQSLIGESNVIAIIATHGHYDHIVNVAELKRQYQCPFYIHTKDAKLIKHANLYVKAFKGKAPIEIPVPDVLIEDEGELDLKILKLQVLHTPGHTQGSVCFLIDNHLFTGDLLLKNKVGRHDFPGGSLDELKSSLKKINTLVSEATIYPGHKENSSLSFERNNNKAFIEIINN